MAVHCADNVARDAGPLGGELARVPECALDAGRDLVVRRDVLGETPEVGVAHMPPAGSANRAIARAGSAMSHATKIAFA
jgi:hypothetical protein